MSDIICVEDNPDFTFFLSRAFANLPYKPDVRIYADGESALENLMKIKESEIPKMIMLDINLPGMSGFDILKKIKEFNPLKEVVVVMLSTSNYPVEINKAYSLGANAYLVKPNSVKTLKSMVASACAFWSIDKK